MASPASGPDEMWGKSPAVPGRILAGPVSMSRATCTGYCLLNST